MSSDPIVFVVDDDDAAATSIRVLLMSVGLTAESFPHAAQFFSAIEKTTPDCVVLDLRMPDRGGLEVQAELLERGLEIPTIMISGHADEEAFRRAMQNGAVACLEKPFSGEELCAIVQRALESDLDDV